MTQESVPAVTAAEKLGLFFNMSLKQAILGATGLSIPAQVSALAYVHLRMDAGLSLSNR